VIGIVASRVVERIHRPTVLIALEGGRGRGSARSIPGFHLHDAIADVSDHLVRFGGHAQAAGLEVERDRIPAFREAFSEVARSRLDDEDVRPRVRIDLELDPASATLELAERARWLGPHGVGNARPVFLSRGVTVREAREVGTGHLRIRIDAGGGTLEGIGFGLAERISADEVAGASMDIAYQLTVNEWRGRRAPQMKLVDLRPPGGDLEREP
jgi:single-stranded-DNA-specific exonuclease